MGRLPDNQRELDQSVVDAQAAVDSLPGRRQYEEAMLAPLRRAVSIAPNDVHAAADLNDEIVPCEERPECALSFGDLNRLRASTFFVMKSWVPEWLWKITPHFAKPWLTKRMYGDLTKESMS